MDDFSRELAAAALIDGQHFTLPGCGTLEGEYVSARIDHGARHVEPPCLQIHWTTAETTAQSFAELLVRTGATTAEADAIQRDWIDGLQAGKEISIGDLGVLKLDEEIGVIGFAPAVEALKNAYWSGGAVHLEPLSKRAINTSPVAPAVPINTNTTQQQQKQKSVVATLIPYLAAASLLIAALLIWRSVNTDGLESGAEEAKVVTVNQERLNRSPREEPSPAISEEDFLDTNDDIAFEQELETVSPETDVHEGAIPSFDPASLAGETEDDGFEVVEIEAVIVVGSFGSADNAAKMTERIAAEGLIPYVDQPDKLTRVGVSFAASSEADIEEMIQRLRADYNPSAWLLEE